MTKTRWLLATVALFAAVLLTMTLVGWLLPEQHLARASTTLDQPADSVWSAIRDLQSYPDWWPQVKAMDRIPDRDTETWAQRDKYGDELPIEVIASEPSRRLVTRITGEGLPFSGTWTYQLTTSVTGTTLTITEDGQIHNPLFRLMARFVLGYHATLDAYLEALARRFGEEPDIAHPPTD
ncbi:MAG: SRPBCC family protein [Gemmatimonadales bacterium]|jgi:uncharacterized protein YndB with AHSA1/START domain